MGRRVPLLAGLALGLLLGLSPLYGFPPQIRRAEAFPICGSTATNVSDTSRTSASFSYTTPAGSNRLLLVIIGIRQADGVSTVVYAGNSLTQVASAVGATGSDQQVQIWRLRDPPTGAATLTVTYAAATAKADGVAAISCTGVFQGGPIGATAGATGTGTGPTMSITTTFAESLIVGGLSQRGGGTDGSRFSPGTGTTELYDRSTGPSGPNSDGYTGGYESAATIAGYTFDFTSAISGRWAIAAVEVRDVVLGIPEFPAPLAVAVAAGLAAALYLLLRSKAGLGQRRERRARSS